MKTTAPHRIPAIDIARGYAVLTMFIAHTQPAVSEGWLNLLSLAGGGERPRTLFAVVGGLALGLFVAAASRRGLPEPELRREIAVRGVALIALGLVLQTMASGVSVVLDTWGLLFLIALPFLRIRSGLLLGGAAVALVAGSALAAALSPLDRTALVQHQVLNQAFDWTVTGSYPVLLWIGFLGVGYAISRLDLGSRRVQLGLLASGAVLGTATLAARALGAGDSPAGTRSFAAELSVHVGAVGFAIALLAALLLVTSGDAGWARGARRVLSPLRAVGSMPLSVYTAHVIALAVWRSSGAPFADTWLPFATLTVASLVAASIWAATLGQGPLERVLAALSRSRLGSPRKTIQ